VTRWGVISDVHANLPALDAVLTALASLEVDRIACAGDLVGYGPHPSECVQRISEVGALTVAGNHDRFITGDLSRSDFPPRALASLDWTQDRLRPGDVEFMRSLPLRADTGRFHVAHGSLADPRRYIDRRSRAMAELARLRDAGDREPVLIVGHTHRQRHFSERRRGCTVQRGRPMALAADVGHVLNPGSVGQSRDWERSTRARFTVLDDTANSAAWHAVPYDHQRTMRDLERAGLPPDWVQIRAGVRREVAAFVRDRIL
jgi:putative phosphoesterase